MEEAVRDKREKSNIRHHPIVRNNNSSLKFDQFQDLRWLHTCLKFSGHSVRKFYFDKRGFHVLSGKITNELTCSSGIKITSHEKNRSRYRLLISPLQFLSNNLTIMMSASALQSHIAMRMM